IFAASVVTALLTTQRTISGSGFVKGAEIGVYWNLECTNATSSINFGALEPGSSKSFTLYLRNEGNSALVLSMSPENWNPTNATDYMTLAWNREGTQINPDEITDFTIVLSIYENITGINSFSLNIVISGTG
ncbi:MAG: hypothetical protein JSV51_09195, partial [Candidatus Bathyarchaeota archaeon]